MADRFRPALILTLAVLHGIPAVSAAEVGQPMSDAELTALLADGETIRLGGPGLGYAGSLDVRADGSATGSAKTDAGATIRIDGTWTVRDGKFCRTWTDLDGGKEVCETWVYTAPNAVEVRNGDAVIGVNAW